MFSAVKATAAGTLFGLAILTSAPAGAVLSTNSSDGFVDNQSTNRTVTFFSSDFTGSSIITDLDVSITFAKHDGSGFILEGSAGATGTPFFNEVEFVLTSPNGTSITLISNDGGTELVAADNFETFNTGGSPNVFSGTILFDQSAADAVDVNPNQIQAGTFRPDDELAGDLDSFLGEDAVGVWTLFIEDDVGADGLSFYEFSVIVNGGGDQAVPEPMAMTLLGTGLLGLGLARRRRRQAA